MRLLEQTLREKLDSMRAYFDAGPPGDFCLIFGPDETLKDPALCRY
jgi:hypothetical protein